VVNDLKIKRSEIVKQAEQLHERTKAENRNYTAEENAQFEGFKTQIAELDSRISKEEYLENQKREDAKKLFDVKAEAKVPGKHEFNIARAIQNFLSGNKHDPADEEVLAEGREEFKRAGHYSKRNELLIPSTYVRALTSSSASNWVKTNQGTNLSMVQTPILYNKIGVTIYDQIEGGKLDLVSASDITAVFATENTSHSQISISPGKATLTPRFLPATSSFTRELLAQTSPQIQQQIMDKFVYALDKAIDKEMFAQLSGITNTIATATTYAHLVSLEAALTGAGTAFVTSNKARGYWKKTSTDAGSGIMSWQPDNTVLGYNAYASPQAPNGFIALGDFSEVAVGFFGGLIILEDPYTNKATGNVDIQVARLCDVKVVNSAAFSVCKNSLYV
jgi:HK97 family phage major capsid protein